MPGQLELFPWADQPDRTFYIQADGRFVKLNEADASAIPWAIASKAAQARWPQKNIAQLTQDERSEGGALP